MDEMHGLPIKLCERRTPRFIPSPATFSAVPTSKRVWHVDNHAAFSERSGPLQYPLAWPSETEEVLKYMWFN